MRYGIVRAVSSSPGFLEISKDEYDSIRKAKRRQLIVLGTEDKFDLLLSNYEEYERALLELTLHQMVFRGIDWDGFQSDLQLVNRRLANLLSAVRLYLDQVNHDLSGMDDLTVELSAAVSDERSKQYDGKLSFRVMEATRNYTQHRSLPVQRLSYPMHVVEPTSATSGMSFSAVPSLDVAQLESDGGFKAAVLEELKSSSRYVPITPMVREYVEGIGNVQERLRTVVDPHVLLWETLLGSVESRARFAFPDHQIGLAVVAEEQEGIWPQIDHIFSDPWKRRQQLRNKNGTLGGLGRRYVTGEVRSHDA